MFPFDDVIMGDIVVDYGHRFNIDVVIETLSTLLELCQYNPLVAGGFPSQMANKAEL